MSKGSKRRPAQVPREEIERRWQETFGGKAKPDHEWDGTWIRPGHHFGGGVVTEVDYVARTVTIDSP